VKHDSDADSADDRYSVSRTGDEREMADTATLSLAVTDHLAIISANHKALMATVTRCSALTLSSVLAGMALWFHYHGGQSPPEWAIGIILSSFGGELWVHFKDRFKAGKKDES
jgi:hypothetical protein